METRSRRKMKEVLGAERQDRYSHLAFAYGIGMPYRRVEFTVQQGARGPRLPSAWAIMRKFFPFAEGESREELQKHEAEAQAWVDTPATPELVAKHQAARASFMAAKAARREKILAERARPATEAAE